MPFWSRRRFREVPHVNGRHDLDGMLTQIDSNTSVVWLCSPNNPTGEYIREAELLPYLEQAPEDVLVVFDAAYYEYVTADDYPALIPLITRYKNVIILHTFSKIYGLRLLGSDMGLRMNQSSVCFSRQGSLLTLILLLKELQWRQSQTNRLSMSADKETEKGSSILSILRTINYPISFTREFHLDGYWL